MISTWLVTGVFETNAGREKIQRTVSAESGEAAKASVNADALRAGKLFLSAQAWHVGHRSRVYERCVERRVCGDCGRPATIVSYRVRKDYSRHALKYACAEHTPEGVFIYREG